MHGLGLTDNVLQDESTLDRDTNTTETIQINASNGDWKWLSSEDVSGVSQLDKQS